MKKFFLQHEHLIPPKTERVVETYAFEPPKHVHQPLVQTIVNELRGISDYPCPSRGDNGLRVALVLDQALDNYYTDGNTTEKKGRADDFWNREDTWMGLKI